jgi:hypothetical protein
LGRADAQAKVAGTIGAAADDRVQFAQRFDSSVGLVVIPTKTAEAARNVYGARGAIGSYVRAVLNRVRDEESDVAFQLERI